MVRVVRSAEELPEWFSTDNYSRCVQLGFRDWYEQLEIRELCHEMAEYPEFYDDISDWQASYGVTPNEFLTAVRLEPIFPFRGTRYESIVYELLGLDFEWVRVRLDFPPGFIPLTHYDMLNTILDWDEDRQQQFVDCLHDMRANRSNTSAARRRRPRFPQLFHPVSTRTGQPVTVALHLSDRVLTESFKLFLANERNKREFNYDAPHVRTNTLAEWCNCGLLQFIDLQIWAMMENVRITNKALANGIFPRNPEKGEENIRKTTRKHAAIVLDPSTYQGISLATLLAYARLEKDFVAEVPDWKPATD